MTERTRRRWLLVALTLVSIAMVAAVGSAHGAAPTQEIGSTAAEMPTDHATPGWVAWMESQLTDHMGPEAGDEMASHTRPTVDDMSHRMAADNHTTGATHPADHRHPARDRHGQGHGC